MLFESKNYALFLLYLFSINSVSSKLSILNVNLYPDENSVNHHTSDFNTVYDNDDLIIRRGQPFEFRIYLSESFDAFKNTIYLQFGYGLHPTLEDKSFANLRLERNKNFMSDTSKWDIDLLFNRRDSFKIRVFIPAVVPVGKWQMFVVVYDIDGERTMYRNNKDIYILFNPWSVDDDVYMANEVALNEYVLNDFGKIHIGAVNSRSAMVWQYGQFKTPVLPAIQFLLDRHGLHHQYRTNAMQLTSVVSAYANYQRSKFGVFGMIWGRWDGKYNDGEDPSFWKGSVEILQRYHKTNGKPVKYGQCWVFAAVLTTIFRALGIPSRTVTNYVSGHDTDNNLVLESYFDPRNMPLDYLTNDSLWNFHVWNEVWMKRSDLPNGYDGWQVVDGTPQERMGGYFRTGPASVKAIKEGSVQVGFDSPFIYSEVNADEQNIKVYPGNSRIKGRRRTDRFGRIILTQKVGFHGNLLHTINDEDLTKSYKYREGSLEERNSFKKASETLGFTVEKVFRESLLPDVDFIIEADNDTLIGELIIVKIKLVNKWITEYRIDIFANESSEYCTGKEGEMIYQRKDNINLASKQRKTIEFEIAPLHYIDKLLDLSILRITVSTLTIQTNRSLTKSMSVALRHPHLKLTADENVKIRKPFFLNITFSNPMPKTLTKCKIIIESRNYGPKEVPIDDIPAKQAATIVKRIKLRKPGNEHFTANLHCKELSNILGLLEITV
ncbi:hemocyte protein-glutamine gamma-glutamyltransferase-like isoform X3, partial [Dinothrombium tinctorium]